MSTLPILVLNAGSSSIKFAIVSATVHQQALLASGAVEGIGAPGQGRCWLRNASESTLADQPIEIADAAKGFSLITRLLARHPELPPPAAIGHRMVCSSPEVTDNQRVTPELLATLERYLHFAPLHTPPALHILRHTLAAYPDVPNFIVLDSWFHRDLPLASRSLPIPERFSALGVHRYGAHGLSYESIVDQLAPHIPQRLIVAHLGNGSSITAIHNGRSVDTSMGLTPTGGLISATRTGDIDPGVLLFLLRQLADSHPDTSAAADALEQTVNRESGLLGVSGVSSDMRALRNAIAAGSAAARLAVDLFTTSIRRFIGAYIAQLGGLDMLVFTGGIGQHDSATRAEVCRGLDALGIKLDQARNAAHDPHRISADDSRVLVRMLAPAEDLIIVRHVLQILASQ